jgi:predicted HTH transcriptional regulator
MYWNGYIEKVGTGTEDIINKCREYGLKTPEFYQEEDFRVVIWRVDEGEIVPGRTRGVPEVCQSVPEQLMALIKANPSISRDELSKQLNISVRQVRKVINQFRNDGVLTREGGDSGRWIINKI